MTDKNGDSLIERLKRNEKDAQTELVKKFNSRILLYFRMRIKGEDSYEDLAQEVFASFFVGIANNKIPEDALIAPFMFGIAKRVMFNFFYKKKRDDNIQKKGEEHFDLSCDFEEEERLENEDMNAIIRQAMQKLPEVDKIILKEFYLKENNLGEVSDILGKSKHYVSVRKERALKKIKNEILKRKDLYIVQR
jgi:RNA polymerase sigma-70 factor (ECF subfamily)